MTAGANNTKESEGTSVNGEMIQTPGYRLLREIGKGANAVVYEAVDELLERRVAIKVWNKRGMSRAQFETAKIARLEHALIVRAYHFNWVGEQAYAVMEIVPGVSGKKWLSEPQSLRARLTVWSLYSAGLKVIYKSEDTHGDPHLGNVLIFDDPERTYRFYAEYSGHSIGVKLADMGTSRVFNNAANLEVRESKIIWETVNKLLKDQALGDVWNHPENLPPEQTLMLLDKLCEFIAFASGVSGYSDMAGQNASILADLVINTPLFDLSKVAPYIDRQVTSHRRFARKVNLRLFKTQRVEDESGVLDAKTIAAYAVHQQAFQKRLFESDGVTSER